MASVAVAALLAAAPAPAAMVVRDPTISTAISMRGRGPTTPAAPTASERWVTAAIQPITYRYDHLSPLGSAGSAFAVTFDTDVVPGGSGASSICRATDACAGDAHAYVAGASSARAGWASLVQGVAYRFAFTAPQLPIPEPAGWMTMILGFAAVGYAMRGRTTHRSIV